MTIPPRISPPAVRETTVAAADGFPLAAQVGGPADAPVLLLLQGQANSHHWWDGLRGAFEAAFRTITMDYRGTGASRGPVGDWTTATFAADAVRVLDAIGAATAFVYGTSMGGRVGQQIAVQYPDRIEALVLACTAPGGPRSIKPSVEVQRSLATAGEPTRSMILFDLFYSPRWSGILERSRLLGDVSMTRPEAAAHRRASAGHDAWDALALIRARTLVLHGSDDLLTPPANSTLLTSRIPGAIGRIYDGGRHGFFDEFASDVAGHVRDFLLAGGPARREDSGTDREVLPD